MLEQKSNKSSKKQTYELLHQLLPSELMDYFFISNYELLGSVETKSEYWVIEFEEKNELPQEYSSIELFRNKQSSV